MFSYCNQWNQLLGGTFMKHSIIVASTVALLGGCAAVPYDYAGYYDSPTYSSGYSYDPYYNAPYTAGTYYYAPPAVFSGGIVIGGGSDYGWHHERNRDDRHHGNWNNGDSHGNWHHGRANRGDAGRIATDRSRESSGRNHRNLEKAPRDRNLSVARGTRNWRSHAGTSRNQGVAQQREHPGAPNARAGAARSGEQG
jgi:hypothetical protein